MNRLRFRALGSIVAVFFLLPAVIGCQQQTSRAQETKQEKASQNVPVKLVSVQEKAAPRTSSQPATVHAYYEADIRPRIPGYVRDVHAEIGDYVEKGQKLATLDVPEIEKQKQVLQAHVKKFEAQEQQAVASVKLAQSDIASAKAKLQQAQSEIQQADADLAASEAEFARVSDLVERQSLERRMLDEARKKRDSSRASLEAAKSAVTSAEAEVAVAEAKLGAAEADLQAAKSTTEVAEKELDEIEVKLNFATLKAPFAGTVTQRHLDPGDLVQVASSDQEKAHFVVSQVEQVRVHIPVPENDAAYIDKGDEVSLTFPSFQAEEPLKGSVTRFAGRLDPSTRTMLVEVVMENQDRKLLPGMFGQAEILMGTETTANMLPARAVRFTEEGNAYVYLVSSDNTVSKVDVKTGLDNGHSIEILYGVEAGQQVVDANLNRFEDGDQVRVLDR